MSRWCIHDVKMNSWMNNHQANWCAPADRPGARTCWPSRSGYLNLRFFCTQNFFRIKFFSDVKIFFRQNIFADPNFFLALKVFRTKNFFRPSIFFRLKIISDPKWASMKAVFGGRKHGFWIWGFLNWQGQRFYFNWSLTLKTKSCFVFCSTSPLNASKF